MLPARRCPITRPDQYRFGNGCHRHHCPAHPLAARQTITLRTLARQPLISLPPGTGLRSSLDAACAAAGLSPTISFEAGDPRILAQLASHGLGVAILPASVTAARPGDLKAVAITRPVLRGSMALAWPADGPANPAARELIRRAGLAGDPRSKS